MSGPRVSGGAGASLGGGPVSQEYTGLPKGSRQLVCPSFRS